MKFRGQMFLVVLTAILASGAALAKNSHDLRVPYDGSVGDSKVATGEYDVSWDGQSTAPAVTFKHGKQVVATASGKWAERDHKYSSNGVIYSANPDGSRRIQEIRFAGMHRVLVFGETKGSEASASGSGSSTAGSQSFDNGETGGKTKVH
jgi:hypothetical protein